MNTLSIYAISLPNSAERRRCLAIELEKLGLPYSIIDAIDGNKLSLEQLRKVCPRELSLRVERALSPSEVGCSLSHRAALQSFLNSKYQYALILEDDAVPASNASELISLLLEGAPGFDIYKIGSLKGAVLR